MTLTRRNALWSATLAAASRFVEPCESGSRSVALAEDHSPLKVALLEEHADKIDPLLETLAEQGEESIELVPLSYEELYAQLSLTLTQRSPEFDVVSIDDVWIPQFATFLLPVNTAPETWDGFVEVADELSRFPSDAPPCGVPWIADVQFFALRPAWLESDGLSAPETWDETIELAEEVDASEPAEEGLAGYALSTLTPHALINSFLPILFGFGAQLIDPQTSVPQLDTPAALAAIQVFEQLAGFSPEESSGTGDSTNILRFQQGRVATMSDFWSSSVLEMRSIDSRPEAGPVQCSVQPAQGTGVRGTMPSVWFAGIPMGSLQIERAERFLDWLAEESTQGSLVERSLPPALSSTYADPTSIAVEPLLPQLLDLLAISTARPRSPYYPQLELLLASELRRLLDQEIDGEEALWNANLAMRAFLAREGILDA